MLADYVIFVQLSATNPNSTTHNGSQHRGGCGLPSPIKTSLALIKFYVILIYLLHAAGLFDKLI